MKAYQTDQNGFLIAEVDCQPSPLEPGQFLIPGGAFTEEPPKFNENEIPKREGAVWIIAPNFSGKKYFHKQTKEEKLFQIGESFDESYTEVSPLEKELHQKFENGKWVIDSIAKEKHENTIKLNVLKSQLASSDWRMTVDKFEEMTLEEQNHWKSIRSDLRLQIRQLQEILDGLT